MIKKFETYIKESVEYDNLKDGDICRWKPNNYCGIPPSYVNKICRVEKLKHLGLKIRFMLSDGNWEKKWWVCPFSDLDKISEEEQEEYNIKQRIKKERKEELRLKMMDVDPYGEEEWDVNEDLKNDDLKVGDMCYEGLKLTETDLSVKMDEVSIDYLNKNFANSWVKIEPELKNYIMHVIEYYKNSNEGGYTIIYDAYKYDQDKIHRINKKQGYFLFEFNTITRYKEYFTDQKFTELDPYGEEDWDD